MKILRKEERPVAIVALIVFAALNALLIANHWQSFTRVRTWASGRCSTTT